MTEVIPKTPRDVVAECAVIGSMILDPRKIGEVVGVLRSSDEFYEKKHAVLFDAMVELYEKATDVSSIDLVQINHVLGDEGIKKIGGSKYMVELAESVPSASSAVYYANLVHNSYKARTLIGSCESVIKKTYDGDEIDEVLNFAHGELFKLSEDRCDQGTSTIGALLSEQYTILENHDGTQMTGLETGFYELDDMTTGLQPGDMIVLAARPSMGKTALALCMATAMAVDQHEPTAFFSMEMSRQQIGMRLMCLRSNVDPRNIRHHRLSGEEFASLSLACGSMSSAPMLVDATPALTLMDLRARVRRLVDKHAIKCVFIDYLQLMQGRGRRSDNRQQEVSDISRGIKSLAMEMNMPIVCLSQLSRASESGGAIRKPRLSDLRDSGAIEQDADVVMLLHREDYYHKDEQGSVDSGVAELHVAKQRNGPTGVVKLRFEGAAMRFSDQNATPVMFSGQGVA